MALQPCKECGGQVSTDAASCLHCGKVIKRTKDISKVGCLPVVVACLFVVFVLAKMEDCGSQPTSNTNPEVSGVPTATQTPSSSPAPAAPQFDRKTQAHIDAGRRLFYDLENQIPAEMNPDVRGQLTSSPTLTLYVTYSIWRGLTRPQQIDLTWYVQSKIPFVRENAEAFARIPANAPFYSIVVDKIRNLCDDCWEIILGDPILGDDGRPDMTVDRAAVSGDSVWQRDHEGAQASKFRRLSPE